MFIHKYMYIDIIHVQIHLVHIVCYCIGYTSDNEWSTSVIPLDQYQEKLRIRREEALEGIHTYPYTHTLLYCIIIFLCVNCTSA